jgi:hypothetical protein
VGAGRRRLAAVGLLVWGLIGLLAIATGLSIGLDVANRAETLITSSDRTLALAAASTRRAADALEGVVDGIGQARDSSIRASGLADDASATLDGLATSMSLSLFGTQPFLPLAANFSESADQAAALADELDALSGSLVTTGADTERLGVALDELASALEGSRDEADAPPLRLGLALALAWIAVPTIGALMAGAALFAGDKRR